MTEDSCPLLSKVGVYIATSLQVGRGVGTTGRKVPYFIVFPDKFLWPARSFKGIKPCLGRVPQEDI